MTRALELAGKVFGELTVVRKVDREGAGGRKWECLCSCGKSVRVVGSKLVQGHTKSCGHLRRGVAPTHGDTGSREYRIWTDMKQRCGNPRRAAYYRYGGRGIKVCARWADYSAFLADMGRAPNSSSQIDRIDNDGDYSPENCRWVTPTENKQNKANTRYVSYAGRRWRVVELAKELGVSARLLTQRISRGWTDEQIVSGFRVGRGIGTPIKRLISHGGETMPVDAWAARLGVPRKTIHTRLDRGWSHEEIVTGARSKGEQ